MKTDLYATAVANKRRSDQGNG